MCAYSCRLEFDWFRAADVGFRVCGVRQSDGTSNSETPNPEKLLPTIRAGSLLFCRSVLGMCGFYGPVTKLQSLAVSRSKPQHNTPKQSQPYAPSPKP